MTQKNGRAARLALQTRSDASPRPRPRVSSRACERLRTGLVTRGVAGDFADALARRLEVQLADRGVVEQEAALDGIATAYALECRTHEDTSRQLQQLRALDRLLDGFVGELEKLDEALEVLSAYVRRMRTHCEESVASRRRLH